VEVTEVPLVLLFGLAVVVGDDDDDDDGDDDAFVVGEARYNIHSYHGSAPCTTSDRPFYFRQLACCCKGFCVKVREHTSVKPTPGPV
jgi:hypothetical protein